MTQLLVVVGLDLAEVTSLVLALIFILFLFLAYFYLDSVDANSHRRACLLSLVPIIVALFPLLIFVGFLGGFRLVLKSSEFLRPGH